jgi:hypothetical protein
MKRLLFCVALNAFLVQVHAQIRSGNPGHFSSDWSEGVVVFTNGDSLQCYLRYNQEVADGLLQVLDGENTLTLLASDVKAFTFYDSDKNSLRNFFALPVLRDQPRPERFVESLYSNAKFSIVNHRTIGMPYDYMNYARFISKPSRISKKYIVNTSTGEIFPLSKEYLFQIMGNRKTEISSFIERYNIKFRKFSDYIHVFEYHASL